MDEYPQIHKPDVDADLTFVNDNTSRRLLLSPALTEIPSLYEDHIARRRHFDTGEGFLLIFPLSDGLNLRESLDEEISLSPRDMYFVPSFTQVTISAQVRESSYIVLPFGPSIQLCNGICPSQCKSSLSHAKEKDENMEEASLSQHFVTRLELKPISFYWRQTLLEALRLFVESKSFYEQKLRELFFFFREIYPREDLNVFLKLFHCHNYGFRAFVYRHHWDCDTVEELAELSQLSLSTFKRIFKEEFRTSPLRWINDQKARYLLRDLEDTEDSLAELAERYHFSTVSYLCAFCKKMLGRTPYAIRKESETG